jgi:hypothetical protein
VGEVAGSLHSRALLRKPARQDALWAGAWLRPRDNPYLIWRSTADPLVAVQPLYTSETSGTVCDWALRCPAAGTEYMRLGLRLETALRFVYALAFVYDTSTPLKYDSTPTKPSSSSESTCPTYWSGRVTTTHPLSLSTP